MLLPAHIPQLILLCIKHSTDIAHNVLFTEMKHNLVTDKQQIILQTCTLYSTTRCLNNKKPMAVMLGWQDSYTNKMTYKPVN